MFKSALFRLTAWYLLILMFISVGFSASIFNLSSREIDQRLRRQITVFKGYFGPEVHMKDVEQAREDILGESEEALLIRLFYHNLFVLVVGGLGSYLLAKQTLKPIEEAHEAQSRFTSDASHELRTPLTVLKTEIEVALRSKKSVKKDLLEVLESNLEEVNKLKYLTDALLKLSHGEDNNKREVRKSLALKKIATSAIELSQKVAAKKKIKIVNSVNEVTVLGMEGELREVLLVLLDNAVKYSPEGSEVVVSSEQKQQQIVLTVTDQGEGVDKIDKERIFDRFYRAESARTKMGEGGFGLGLSIAKQLVELMDGEIKVISSNGEGSKFGVFLDRA